MTLAFGSRVCGMERSVAFSLSWRFSEAALPTMAILVRLRRAVVKVPPAQTELPEPMGRAEVDR
jgi:hypothetical protein